MELFDPKKLTFDWTKGFKFMGWASIILTVLSLISIFAPGINYGIDFRGGIESRVDFKDTKIDIGTVRSALEGKLNNVTVVEFGGGDTSAAAQKTMGNEFSITAQSESTASVATDLRKALTAKFGAEGDQSWKVVKLDEVGRKVGADFRKSAFLSLLYTCLLIVGYMYWRFDARYSPGALACIFHDLLVATGFIVLTRMEFSTQLVAALLTLAGYSINDTVVVFDRIRELEGKYIGRDRKAIVNEAVNSTLSRTIMTSSTTLISCAVIYFLGGPTLRDFALVLIVGIIVGTYSSTFVAAPLYIWADKKFGGGPNAPAVTTTARKPKHSLHV